MNLQIIQDIQQLIKRQPYVYFENKIKYKIIYDLNIAVFNEIENKLDNQLNNTQKNKSFDVVEFAFNIFVSIGNNGSSLCNIYAEQLTIMDSFVKDLKIICNNYNQVCSISKIYREFFNNVEELSILEILIYEFQPYISPMEIVDILKNMNDEFVAFRAMITHTFPYYDYTDETYKQCIEILMPKYKFNYDGSIEYQMNLLARFIITCNKVHFLDDEFLNDKPFDNLFNTFNEILKKNRYLVYREDKDIQTLHNLYLLYKDEQKIQVANQLAQIPMMDINMIQCILIPYL